MVQMQDLMSKPMPDFREGSIVKGRILEIRPREVLVDIADVVINNGTPYYRYGNQGYDDRLIVARDRYGRGGDHQGSERA